VEQGILENTLIIFTSDNGPTYAGGVDAEFFNSAKPFKTEYGWAKGFLHEGGIRVPMIASWKNKINQGSSTDHLSAFQDVLPTMLELCGIQSTNETDGISFLNILLGGEQADKHEYLYWEIPEYGGQQALRIDNFKAIRKNIFKGNLNIQLFDLSTDIQETKNVAEQFPEIVKQAKEIMDKEHSPSVLPRFQFPLR
jgi:arylsulfatase